MGIVSVVGRDGVRFVLFIVVCFLEVKVCERKGYGENRCRRNTVGKVRSFSMKVKGKIV